MAKIKLQTDLGPIEFSSPEEAAAFFQAMQPKNPKPNGIPAQRRSENSGTAIELRVLNIVRDAGPGGLASTELAQKLGLVGPKGLNSIGRPMVKRLAQYHLEFEHVITKDRAKKQSGTGFYTIWKPGEQLDSVLAQIKEDGL